MLYSKNYCATLDACVLYPAPLRDLLLSFAQAGLFSPKWSEQIQDEWTRNLLKRRTDLKRHHLNPSIEAMNHAFPDADVKGYIHLIQQLHLPDSQDRHVLAAAIQSRSDVIVTYKLKDFPDTEVSQHKIKTQHPDVFLVNLFDLAPQQAFSAFERMVARLKNPPIPPGEVIATLESLHLSKISSRLNESLH